MIIDKDLMAYLSLSINVVTTAIYLRAMMRHQIKPHLFSWVIWAIESAIVAYAQHVSGAGIGAVVSAAAACACVLISVFSFFCGEKKITRSDWFFFLAAIAAIPLWLLTSDPIFSVVLVTLIDVSGYIPTMRKSRINPGQENLTMFVFSSVGYGLCLLALEAYSWTTALYPATLFVVNAIFSVMLIMWRSRKPLVP